MNYYFILPLVQVVSCLALAAIVLKGHLRSVTHHLFCLFLLSLSTWGLVIFAMRASPDTQYAYFWVRLLIPLGPLISVLIYHFAVRCTGRQIKRWLLPSLYGFCLLCIPLAATGLVFSGMQIKPYGYAPIFGPAMGVWILFEYGVILMAMLAFLRVYRNSQDSERRNRAAYITAGFIILLIGGAFDVLPVLGLPLYPGVIIGNIAFCLIATVAIVKYNLLDINIILRKGAAYLIISTMIGIPYVGVLLLLHQLFAPIVPIWANFIILVVLAIFLQPIWQRVQHIVDRWFYHERYDFLAALEDFSQKAHNISNLNQLSSSLIELVSRALRTSNAHLFLGTRNGDFTVVASSVGNAPQSVIESDSPLLLWMQSNRSILYSRYLTVIPQLRFLTMKERSELKKMEAELIVPIMTKEKELVGLLALGEKLTRQPYSQEEERLLLAIASRLAVELENARLYDSERTARKELEEQNEQRTEFLHNITHELKTPLSAIISSSELLSEAPIKDHKLRERLIGNIRQSAWTIDRRVSELLDLAKMRIGQLMIEPEPLETGSVIAEIASKLSILFEKKEQNLKVEIPDSTVKVNADREKLEQVLFNLLSNANKFSPAGSDITLRVRALDKKVIVEIEDSAQSIAEGEKNKLFNAYYRGEDRGRRERFSGLGLGLAISKRLVELHQGEIWVENRPGKGNVFAFSLSILEQETEI
ncbi:ATP-binding protein [Chloroflexota bacterium]